jgi:protein-disulfide isomerase
MRTRPILYSLIAMAILLACSTSGAREGAASDSPAAGAKQYREGLAGVDFTGMSTAQKDKSLDIMNTQTCDCGCGMTIAQCRVEDKSCGRSPVLAAAVLAAVKSGKDDAGVASAVKAVARQAAPAAPAAAPAGPVTISMKGVNATGNDKAKAVLVEFADYQCPYCVRAVEVVKQLQEKYPNDLKYVYKQFPLSSIHKFAEPASRASLAAARQGKFWEMHEKLFANARALDDASLKKYAQDIGLDAARFEKDFGDPAISQQVQADVTEGSSIGVQGTPSFFVNGVPVPSWDVDTISKMIEAARTGGDVKAAAAEMQAVLDKQRMAAREAQLKAQEEMAKRVVDIDVAGAPVKGDPKAPVTIVEFADYQCPYCASSQPLVKQVLDAFPGKVKLVYKHLPLVSIHPNARPAALAAAEAMQQGKFWEMHELLFQNYNKLDRATLSGLAKQAGLNVDDFEKSMQSEEHKALVEKDMADSQRAGVTGTPTFFINGKRLMQRDFDTFKRMIEEALAKPAGAAS